MKLQFNLNELNELLRHFYTLTHMIVAVYDDSFHKITEYPHEYADFCQLLRSDENANEACILSDFEACRRCQIEKKTRVYQCHAGMTEAIAPILYGENPIGYLMFGRLLQSTDKENSWNKIKDYISSYNVNMESARKAYMEKENTSDEIIFSAASIMQACAAYIYSSKMISYGINSLSEKIDSYINGHLSEELTAETICSRFRISRSRLYEISNTCYGTGISAHIRKLRVEKARQLLKESDEKIRDIALKCGIPDYNYFTKIFKKETGSSPKDYRKTNR